jgi:hypothetical protein
VIRRGGQERGRCGEEVERGQEKGQEKGLEMRLVEKVNRKVRSGSNKRRVGQESWSGEEVGRRGVSRVEVIMVRRGGWKMRSEGEVGRGGKKRSEERSG